MLHSVQIANIVYDNPCPVFLGVVNDTVMYICPRMTFVYFENRTHGREPVSFPVPSSRVLIPGTLIGVGYYLPSVFFL